MKALNVNLKVEQNGELVIKNDRTSIAIHPDGTVAVSTLDPLQLTGCSLVKFDDVTINVSDLDKVLEALARRIDKK